VAVEARRSQILSAARRDGRVTVDALATELSVSAHTIRRDINKLCEASKLRRLHGGAEYMDPMQNLPYRTRAVMNARAKQAIGRCVARIVPDGVVLFISIGTTPAIVAGALAEKQRLTVVTNNLNAANALAAADGNRIILPGGELRLPDRDLLGAAAVEIFDSYTADFGIYGVGGIEQDGTLLDFHEDEVRARERIRSNSRRSILVADQTKFGRRAPVRGGHLEDADFLVLDSAPEHPFRDLLKALRGQVVVADTSAPAQGERVNA